jgi:hypothetical protein
LDARRRGESTTPSPKFSIFTFNSASERSPSIDFEHWHPDQLNALSLPIIASRLRLVESSLARWTESPTTMPPAEMYPRPAAQGHDIGSPSDATNHGRSRLHARGSSSGSVVSMGDDVSSVVSRTRYNHDKIISPEHDSDFQREEIRFRRLHIGEYSDRPDPYSPGVTMGQKRRASSPPMGEGPPLYYAGDLYRRRESASRPSPSSRYQSVYGSMFSSASVPRSTSYASTPSLGESSIASMNSYRRLSPGVVSLTPTDCSDLPYVTSLPGTGGSMSRTNHNRKMLNNVKPPMALQWVSDTAIHSKQCTSPKAQAVFICECCPRKHKIFDSREELKYSPSIHTGYSI